MSESPSQVRREPPSEERPQERSRYQSPPDERRGRSRSGDRRRPSRSPRSRSPRDRDEGVPGSCIYIAKLSRHTREGDLKEAFTRFGPIRKLVLKSTYAFLTFETPEAATEAIARMNGAKFVNGEEIVVETSGTGQIMTFFT